MKYKSKIASHVTKIYLLSILYWTFPGLFIKLLILMSFSYLPPPPKTKIYSFYLKENTTKKKNTSKWNFDSVNKLTLCSTFSQDFNLLVFPFLSSSIFITVHCGVCSDHSLLIKDGVLFTQTPAAVLYFLSPLLFSCPSLPILSFFWEMMSVQVRYNYD